MSDAEIDEAASDVNRGWAPAHSWRWFLLRAAKHVPKATTSDPRWKFLGASFFSILQAIGQAANEDGTNAFLGTQTLMAVGRCSKETVHKVLLAAEAMQLIRKTAHARGGRNPKPATYACTLPIGANAKTGKGLDWERAVAVLSSSEHDRRLRHKRANETARQVTPDGLGVEGNQRASRDAGWVAEELIQRSSRDKGTGRHLTEQGASHDAPTRVYQALDHEMADAPLQPQVDGTHPPQDHTRCDPLPAPAGEPPAVRRVGEQASRSAAADYEEHAAACERCSRELWCSEGSRLRRYLMNEQSGKRARYLSGDQGHVIR
ncbi:hypothetical protein OG906_00365 [Streptomyces sp. NBC_01426]|uniref:hypothetical protein n=1 Tax=Streptomyces sp. NBC_01426 TaxID=2975866 RepID=UPI002E34029E|nr:hypothetical protein [Streptomyces sp. NBC_01426]